MVSHMSNPARELHKIFSAWRGTNTNPARPDQRRANNGDETKLLQSSIAAMKFLVEVDQLIDDMRSANISVEIYKKYVLRWAKIILAYPLNWRENARMEDQFPHAQLDSLEMLANQFDLMNQIQPLVISHVQRFINEIQKALDEDESIDPEFSEYMQHLLDAVASGIKHGDAQELRVDLQHLWFAVFAAEEFTEKKGWWRTKAEEYGKATFVQTVASIPGAVLQAISS